MSPVRNGASTRSRWFCDLLAWMAMASIPDFASALTTLSCPCPRRVFFFFQAEDGIRDWSVTGVQTCALPISPAGRAGRARMARFAPHHQRRLRHAAGVDQQVQLAIEEVEVLERHGPLRVRSEERRVGKGGRDRGSPPQSNIKTWRKRGIERVG